MAEEFVEDIISGTATTSTVEPTKDSSSTEADVANVKDVTDVKANETGKDQSSNQTTNADTDQTKSTLSVEELAAQLGWNKDHKGEDAVDAATYILRSKDIQKSMSKHNKDLKENLSTVQASINALKEHNERVYKAEVKRLENEIVELKKKRNDAIELADVNKANELDEQIEGIKKDITEVTSKKEEKTTPAANANPVFDEWVKDNQWYVDDSEMAAYADTVAQNYVGAPLPRIYALVRQKVQEVFPEKFAPTKSVETKPADDMLTLGKAKPVGPASPVERSTNNKGNSSAFSKADLTPEQLNIMNQFVHGGIMTEEAYINDIAKMQE